MTGRMKIDYIDYPDHLKELITRYKALYIRHERGLAGKSHQTMDEAINGTMKYLSLPENIEESIQNGLTRVEALVTQAIRNIEWETKLSIFDHGRFFRCYWQAQDKKWGTMNRGYEYRGVRLYVPYQLDTGRYTPSFDQSYFCEQTNSYHRLSGGEFPELLQALHAYADKIDALWPIINDDWDTEGAL